MKRAAVFWFTGMSGAGKTTLANGLKTTLEAEGYSARIFDGDDVRNELHRHLGFTEEDIKTNNALIADLCETHRTETDAILVPIISPYRASRAAARKQLAPDFFEIHVYAAPATLEARDTKGLYAKARQGELDNLIGVSRGAPYEAPQAPDIVVDTVAEPEDMSLRRLFAFAVDKLDTTTTRCD
jgi:adenylyl-sulfate kinase